MTLTPLTHLNHTIQRVSNITPFTYRDGMTYLQILEKIRSYIRDDLVPWTEQNMIQLDTDWNAIANELIGDVEGQLSSQTAEFNALVQQIIGNSIELQDDVVTAIIGDENSESRIIIDNVVKESLRSSVGINVLDYGAIGDGVHDDTAAIQAAINACKAGETVIFPPSGSTNKFYRITSGLLVTTPSIRLLGQPRDGYSVSIRCAVPNVTMITVKHAGFVMENLSLMGVENLSNGGVNGLGANVNGLDLYGTIRGDIDSDVKGCTFQYLATSVRVRARNSRFSGLTLFNNVIKGIVFDGIDPIFHTDPAAVANNRGNTVEGCRFHNVGLVYTDASITFTNTANVTHAIIKDNYQDSWSQSFVRAIGTAGAIHQRISCHNNVITEMQGHAYEFEYVYNSVINGATVYGAAFGPFPPIWSRDVIKLSNCINILISNAFAYQVGRNGITGIACSDITITNAKLRSLGNDTATQYHGFEFDSACADIKIVGSEVTQTTGYGFKGDPTVASLSNNDFNSCALGRMSSKTTLNTVTVGNNTFVEGEYGRIEDTGRKTFDLLNGVAKKVATINAGSNFGSCIAEVEFTARHATTGMMYIVARRAILAANGSPTFTTIGSDSTVGATISFTANGPTGVDVNITPSGDVFGSVVVRVAAGGSASGTNQRGTSVTMQ